MSSTSLLDQAIKRKTFEDGGILAAINNIFKKKNKSQFTMPLPGSTVVLLISGGLDSIGLWFMLLNRYKLVVYPIYCYLKDGENKKQWESILFFSEILNKRFPSLYRSPMKNILPSGFSFRDQKIDAKKHMSLIIPNLYRAQYGGIRAAIINNPTRIYDYMSQAISFILKLKYQKNIDSTTIFMGYIPEDAKATREPTLTVLRTMNLVLSLTLGDFSYRLMAPIDKKSNFYFLKSELLKYASEYKLPMDRTWSCLKSGLVHCGSCTSCRMRKDAFRDSGLTDKTKYSPRIFSPPLIHKFIKRLSTQVVRKFTQSIPSSKSNITISTNSRLIIDPDIDWESIEGVVYRFHRISGKIDCLNEVGSYIWQEISISPHISINELSRKTAKEFRILNEKKTAKEITTFIKVEIREGYISL